MIQLSGNQQVSSFQNVMSDQMECVKIDAFFYWYVEVVGKRKVAPRAVRQKPSLLTGVAHAAPAAPGPGAKPAVAEPLSPLTPPPLAAAAVPADSSVSRR